MQYELPVTNLQPLASEGFQVVSWATVSADSELSFSQVSPATAMCQKVHSLIVWGSEVVGGGSRNWARTPLANMTQPRVA